MTARELFQAGKLDEAVQALNAELRNDPGDEKRRTFLFELLAFTGAWDRAEKQLDILAQAGRGADMGALVYRAALHAERTRQELFDKRDFPQTAASSDKGPAMLKGTLNGKPFTTIEDADPRIGSRLEVYAAGDYLWISFEHLASVTMQPPKRLRDLIWSPAIVKTGPGFKGTELGEVLTPILTPSAWKHSNDEVRLGRVTDWERDEDGRYIPVGQKMLLVDGEEFPLLEVRQLEFEVAQAVPQAVM